MRKYILTSFALAMFVLVVLLGGCSSSNKEGQPASLSTAVAAASVDNNLQAEITGVTINSAPVVTFRLLDERGAPLDPAPLLASGNIRFSIAQIKADGNYANYFGTTVPTQDTAGTIAALGGGMYTYTFSRDITITPNFGGLVYDATKTHTAAIEVFRNITDALGQNFQQAQNAYLNFRPDGGVVAQTREIVASSNCNVCHLKLGINGRHGGSRREVALCILCHNPGLVINGVSFDFKALVHKIHMGKKLSGNVAAIAAAGVGFSLAGDTFATVGHPFISGDGEITETPVECVKCHKVGTDINGRAFGRQVNQWKNNPTRENCATCHATTTFDGELTVNVADATLAGGIFTPKLTSVASVPHFGGPGWPDDVCRACHPAELDGDNAYKRSVTGHHTIFEQSSVFTGLNFEILSVTNATPGNKPVVTFRITDDAGNAISPAGTGGTPPAANSFTLKLGYFRQTDYVNDGLVNLGQPLSQALAAATANADGSFTITFATAIPAGARGTGVVGLEGTRTYTIPATEKKVARNVGTSGDGIQYYFDLATGAQVTDPLKQRRTSVDIDRCNLCHGGSLSLHGGNRKNSVQECVICHNPNATDRARRPAVPVDGLAEQSINFKDMIHKIHTGERLEVSKLPLTTGGTGYIIYGRNSSVNDFAEVRYPKDRRDCLACHVTANPPAFGFPLPDGALGTTTATGTDANNAVTDDNTRTPPMTAACVACHDKVFSINHAAIHVTGTGAAAVEGCAACHSSGLLQGADIAHKPVR